MKSHLLRSASITCMLALLALAVSCGERVKTGPRIEESRSMDLLGAEDVSAEIEMKAGTLRIGGGAAGVLEADFVYNVEEWKPVLHYDVEGGHGDLSVRMPKGDWSGFGKKVKYEWDLRFNDQVPLDLTVELGAGESHLKLASLHLTKLKVLTGAGGTYVDLDGNPTLEQLSIYTGAGGVELSLAGDWDHDLEARIKGGVGSISLKLPASVGVRVDASKGIGRVRAEGFVKQGGDFVNEAYGKPGPTLSIDIEAAIGEINLELEGASGEEGTLL